MISVWFKGFAYLNICIVIWTCCWMLCYWLQFPLTAIWWVRWPHKSNKHHQVKQKQQQKHHTSCTFQLKKTAANKHLAQLNNSISQSVRRYRFKCNSLFNPLKICMTKVSLIGMGHSFFVRFVGKLFIASIWQCNQHYK